MHRKNFDVAENLFFLLKIYFFFEKIFLNIKNIILQKIYCFLEKIFLKYKIYLLKYKFMPFVC